MVGSCRASYQIKDVAHRTDVKVSDMLFFDDNYEDVLHVHRLGATAIQCADKTKGLTLELLDKGFELHAAAVESSSKGLSRPLPPPEIAVPHRGRPHRRCIRSKGENITVEICQIVSTR